MSTTAQRPTSAVSDAASALNLDTVEAISERAGDAGWLRELRLASFERFLQLPMPSRRDEHWRFTNLRRFKLDAVQAPEATASQATISTDTLPVGVIVMPLEQAAREHADLVQRHLGTAVKAQDHVDDKFVALNEALWSGGLFVYVPKNVKVEGPVLARLLHYTVDASSAWRLLVVLEEGAEATVVESFASAGPELTGFSNAVVELVVGNGAILHYVTIQDWSPQVTHFATHRAVLARDAQIEWTAVGLGAGLGKNRMEVRLTGEGSSAKLTGAYFVDGRQEMDYDTQQFHEAPMTFSDLAFKGVLGDSAHSVWRGMIDVDQGAQGTDAYQENRNLVLSPKAHADSIPGLEIEANEVRCTHGATIGKVDPEQLFYLQARGISRSEAIRTIVRGFFLPITDRITVDDVRTRVVDVLDSRIDRVS